MAPARLRYAPSVPVQARLRDLVARHAFAIDGLGHRLPLPKRLSHNLCLAADVTVGWGPDASDWESARTPFLRWFYRWFWDESCPTCGGKGEIRIWRRGDPTNDFHPETCPGCEGRGQMSAEIVALV